MVNKKYNIGTVPDESELYPAGIAYVVIPVDVDRDKYIIECYKTSTVSIFSEYNGFSNRVPVDKHTLNFIVFPENIADFGSAVSYKCDLIHRRPIVDGIYFKTDELCDLQENQFKFKRMLDENLVEIVGSPQGKYLGLNVSVDKGGEVYVNVKSKDSSGKINITVDGECNITSLSDTTLKQNGKLSIVTVNKNDDEEYTAIQHTSTDTTKFSATDNIYTSKLNINDGNQNFILGQLFKAFMKDFITEVSNSTVTTDMGQMPLLNKAKIANYATEDNLNKFLSTIGFIDK